MTVAKVTGTPFRPGRGVILLGLLLGFLLIVATAATWSTFARAATHVEWDPLGDFPTQVVLVQTSTTVTIEGTKCYDEPVDVNGVFSWQSIEPPGTVIEVGRGTFTVSESGCITQVFENPIPPEVLAAEEARGPILWKLTGTEIPVDEVAGRQGVPHTWESEPFTLGG